MVDDDELLESWRLGDRAAGEALFERYFEPVRRFFAARVGGDVDDLIQQTFEACVLGRDRVREDGGFRSYLFGVTYNVLRDHRRRRRRHGRAGPLHATMRSDAPGPSTWMRAREDAQRLREGLAQLPRPLQMVLELHYYEGLSAVDIARVLACPEGTVRSRLRRGRQLLTLALRGAEAGGDREDQPASPRLVPFGPLAEIEPT